MTTQPLRRTRFHPLLILCLAYTLLVFSHSAATPVFEAPDEVWHYAYVRWIAGGHGLPSLTDDSSGANQEAAQPPLYYGLAALLSGGFRDDDLSTVLRHNPGFGHQAPTTSVDNKNMLIHPAAQAIDWHGAVLALRITRLTSWLFGLVTVWAAWGLGMAAFENRRWALVTAALVAFQPQFVFISSVVSNDSAAAAAAGVALWLGVAILRWGTTWKRALVAGLIAGLAALTKMSVLPVLPYLAVCLVGSALLGAPPTGTQTAADGRRRSYLARHAGYLAAFALVALSLGGWWYGRNLRQVGDLLGLQHHTTTMWGRTAPVSVVDLLPELPLLFSSFWGAYGWGHITWPGEVYVLLALLTLPLLGLALAAIGQTWMRAIHRWAQGDTAYLRALLRGRTPAGGAVLAGSLSAVWLAGITAALVRWMLLVEAPHGRLLFPALTAWALLLALALRDVHRWLGQTRATEPGRTLGLTHAILAVSAALAMLAPGARILATFAPPRLVSPADAVAQCAQPRDFRYSLPTGSPEGVAHLLCADAVPDRVAPGELVTVRACWTAERPMAKDYTVFVHLLGPDNLRVAERHTYPGLGRYPTSLWVPGRAFCDHYTLEVAGWADTPTRYRLEIGLFDALSGDRLRANADPAIAGDVTVVAGTRTANPTVPFIATFGSASGGPIALTAYDLAETAAPGDQLTVTLHWSATGTPSRDYVAFVHLWRPGDPAPLAQHDAQPRNGWYPTSNWRTGDSVPDTHTLILPADLPPGTYPLWAGLYDASDHSRLPAYAGAPLPHDMVSLGTLEVTE
jgi:hypothetical protein